MRRERKRKTLMASFLTFLLVVSTLITPISVLAQVQTTPFLPTSEGKEASVSQEVYDAFKEQEFVEILVEMREQVDTSDVATQSKNQLTQSVLPSEEKLFTRNAVVDALKETAEETQKSLLEQLYANPNVKDVNSYYIMNVVYVKATEEVVKEIKKNPNVKRITLDEKIEVDWPEITSQVQENMLSKTEEGSLLNTEDPSVEWNIDHIDAPQVWNEFGVDGSGVVVGLIDSGATWNHEALMEKWRGYDPLDPSNPEPTGNWFDAVNGQGMPYDIASSPHGTHVLGTILGQDPNGENKIGVAPGAKWIAAKAFTTQGGQQSWLLGAGQFMLAPNDDPSLAPDIINNSWGGGSGIDEWYRPMVQAWRDAQILPVFAAGNDYPSKVSTPGNYPESYAVGATDINNRRGSFSSVGPGPYDDDLKPDIAAPGVNIRSSVPGGYQGGWNGTSMATPHISGVAALLRSVDPSISVDDLEEIINSTATPLTDSQYPEAPNYGYGNGLVNAFEAVSTVASGVGGITGSVLKEGTDEEEPVIVHDADLFSYKSLDVNLEARVTDNISVVETELFVREDEASDWEVVPFERVTGDYLDGQYGVTVPASYVAVPGFQYKVRATDFSGNFTETEVYDVEVEFGIDPSEPFEFGFETDLEGMLLSKDWQRGIPTAGPTPTEGGSVVATNLSGNYSNHSDSFLQLPPLDLRNVEEASLSFKHWFDIEYPYDHGKVLVTDDIQSEEWVEVETFTGRERTWNDFSVDLSGFTNGNTQVFIGLLLESDGEINHPGWYIDELLITNNAGESSSVPQETTKVLEPVFETVILENQSEYEVNNTSTGLPVEAFVTVVETGKTAKTSLQDGTFNILHSPTPEGESYTLRVESYGYYPQEVEFTLGEEEVIEESFLLQEIPRGEIEVTVVDQNENPLEGVRLELIEDSQISPVTTNDNGVSTLNDVLEGSYTLRATLDNYQFEEVAVEVAGGDSTQIEVTLNRFPGTVVKYDDGTAENARVFNESGYGFVTRMTVDQRANITGASIYLWGEDWPYPGGNEFSVTIYDSDEEGNPGQRVFEPKQVEGTRGEWNFIDLSEYEFSTDQDYYVVMLQSNEAAQSPGIGIDESGTFADRTYILNTTGTFEQLGEQYGNFMIRSHVTVSANAPVLDHTGQVMTNHDTYEVGGTVQTDGLVTIYNNDEEVMTTDSINNQFSVDLPLHEGENVITTTVTVEGMESDHSQALTVTQDQTAPELILDPLPTSTNAETLLLQGQVIEEYLELITVNGDIVTEVTEGSFEYELQLEEGMNRFEIVASDLIGNSTVTMVEVERDTIAPEILTVSPNEDVYVLPGESITVTMTSDMEGAVATLVVKDESQQTVEELSMAEVEPSKYEVEWTVPEDLANFSLQFEAEDHTGNKTTTLANGTVYVDEQMDRIFGENRYETAVEVSKLGWDTAETVILARGDDYADALAGIPLAYQLNSPVLLTRSNRLNEATIAEIERLQAEKVIILGGEMAISGQIEAELIDSGVEVERIAGITRSETAVLIAERMNVDLERAIVVNGMDFPDALSVASFAASEELPILLSLADRLPEHTKSFMDEQNITDTVVVGGASVVSDKVLEQLPNPTRISGSNRYETNVALFDYFSPNTSKVYVATGTNYADALTGSILAAKAETGILLTKEKIPSITKQFLQDQDVIHLRILGGPAAISNDVYVELETLLN